MTAVREFGPLILSFGF